MSYSNSSGAHALSNSSDVALSSPQQADVLSYNSTTQKWTNAPAGAGSSATSDATSLSSYGPTADGLYGMTGSITSGSKTLSFSTGGLTNTHVGASVRITGAGASAAVLTTTITAVSNASTATLAAAASTTVTNAMTHIGHDNVTSVYNALQAAAGKRLTFPVGTYFMSGGLPLLAGTKLDLSGATILYGGFTPADNSEIANGTFVGDASGQYGTAIYIANTSISHVSISNNIFQYHNWGILQNIQQNAIVSLQQWIIANNRFDRMQLGCTYIGGLVDSKFDNNVSTNIVAGSNTYNFQNTTQRCSITNNTVNGGRAGIIFLAGVEYMPTVNGQSGEVWGNYISGNRVVGPTEEGISFDGTMSIDNLTVASINTSARTITVSESAYASAGSRFQSYWINVLSGTLTSRIFRITTMSNKSLTLEIDATDIAQFSVGDSLTIALPFRENRVENNFVDGRNSSTYSIWLYGMSVHNTLSGNTCEGATIGLASLNSMAPTGLNLQSGLTTSSSSGYNVITGNVVSGFSSVSATYSNGPGIELAYVQYGSQADVYTYGNIVSSNVVPNGTITGQRNQKLTASNVARGGASYSNSPPSAPLSFV